MHIKTIHLLEQNKTKEMGGTITVTVSEEKAEMEDSMSHTVTRERELN